MTPLGWLLAVTMTAGWMKLFSADPRLGFLSAAADFRAKLAADGGTPPAQVAVWQQQLMNSYINAAVTGVFLVLVVVVVVACARVWWQLLAGRRAADLREEPYVPLAGSPAVR